METRRFSRACTASNPALSVMPFHWASTSDCATAPPSVAPGPVTLKGAVVFWLMRFPLDLVLEHTAEGGVRTVRWDAADERFATRGGWRLEALAPERTRVEYLLDARVAFLPDFVVKVVLRDNLPPVLRALGGVAAE